MNGDPCEPLLLAPEGDRNRALVVASAILLGLVCLLALVPVLGFASWLVAGPVLFVVLVMGIIILARGGTVAGLAILLVSLIGAPLFILVAPFLSSLLGLGAAVGASADAMRRADMAASSSVAGDLPETSEVPSSSLPTPASRPSPKGEIFSRDEFFQKLKSQVQSQAGDLAALKERALASEGPRGFLAGAESLDLAQRELVQRENYYREQIFDFIARKTGTDRERVAAAFAAMVSGGGQPSGN